MDFYVRLVFKLHEPSSYLFKVGLVSNVNLKSSSNYFNVNTLFLALYLPFPKDEEDKK
jgi:hypothetical protein